MAFAPLDIPGVDGVFTTTAGFLGGDKFSVDGQRIRPHGFPRNRLTLPGTSRPIEAKVKTGLFRPYPTLVVGPSEYQTGPPVPGSLRVLAVLPLIGLLLIQGALGFLIAFGAMAVNFGILRASQRDAHKRLLMLSTFASVVVIDVAILAVLLT